MARQDEPVDTAQLDASVRAAYPDFGDVDLGGFQFAADSAPSALAVDDAISSQPKLQWPGGIDPQVFDQQFVTPKFDGWEDTSSFSSGIEPTGSDRLPWASIEHDDVDGGDLPFHQSLTEIMDEGEMASRTTISEHALTDHHYHGPIEGVRYG